MTSPTAPGMPNISVAVINPKTGIMDVNWFKYFLSWDRINRLTQLDSGSVYDTRAAAAAASIAAAADLIYVGGFSTIGDGGAAWWARAASMPSHLARFQDSTGSWWALNENIVYPEMVGIVSSATDAAILIENLFTYTSQVNLRSGATYYFTTTCDIPANCQLVGPGWNASIYKNANINMFTMAQGAVMRGITAHGNGATRTGFGVMIQSGHDQTIFDCNIYDMESACVAYQPDIGIRSCIRGGFMQCTTITNYAIQWPFDVSNGDRLIDGINCGGGALVLTNTAQNGGIVNCDTTLVGISTGSHKIRCQGNRIANAAISVTMSVDGTQHTIIGNIISGNLLFSSGMTNSVASLNVVAGTITDSSDASNYKVGNIV